MKAVEVRNTFYNDYQSFPVDRRITYPSYKSFDEFIDVDHLKSLDKFLTDRINAHFKSSVQDYFVNLYRLDETSPYQPGVREIWLTRTKEGSPSGYLDMVDDSELWEPTQYAAEFEPLMRFIATLPFNRTGRILIIYDNEGREVPAHRDHLDPEICNDFIWFRTNLNKPFYVLNNATGEKKYVDSYSAWFDTVNQYHGSEAVDGLTFSIRVDGAFTHDFRKQIPKPRLNPASTPSLWASI